MAEGITATTCRHHIKLSHHALNLAIYWEMLGTNPTARVPLFHENNKVKHYLDDVEPRRFLTDLGTDENRPTFLIA
jgi:hypothetical protein